MRIAVSGFAGLALGLAGPALAQAPAPAGAPAPSSAFVPLVGGRDFISPMGEPVRSNDTLSGAEHWFERVDTDHDGRITRGEMRADADRFFATLDTDRDGELGPDEIAHYENDVAPEIQVMSTYGDASLAKTDDQGNVTDPPYPTRLGAGRYGYLDMPEPVITADANLDRAISKTEFEQAADRRFVMLDTRGDGAITRDELPKLDASRYRTRRRSGPGPGGADLDNPGGRHGGMGDMGGAGGGMGGAGGDAGGMGGMGGIPR